MAFSIVNHPFGGSPIYGNPDMDIVDIIDGIHPLSHLSPSMEDTFIPWQARARPFLVLTVGHVPKQLLEDTEQFLGVGGL